MDATEASNVARLLQQCHAGFGFLAHALLPAHREKTVTAILSELPQGEAYGHAVFGFSALAFIYAHQYVYEPLGQPASILEPIDVAQLGVTTNDGPAGEDPRAGCLRHLRNSFAHGRWSATSDGVRIARVALHDRKGAKETFRAECDASALAKTAERVLIAAHTAVAAVAAGPSAPGTP